MEDLEKRIIDLESKFAFQDELVNELNLIVADQQKTISHLIEALKSLRESTGEADQNSSLKDEKPPHY